MITLDRLLRRTDEIEWRIRHLEWNISRGKQDSRDLAEVIKHGYVTKPVDDIRQMNIDAAREIDARYKPRKHDNDQHYPAGGLSASCVP